MTTGPNSGLEIIAPGASGQSSSELINPVFRSADLLCGTAHSLPCIHTVTDTSSGSTLSRKLNVQLQILVPVVSRLLRLFGSLSYGARPFKRDFTRSVATLRTFLTSTRRVSGRLLKSLSRCSKSRPRVASSTANRTSCSATLR